MKHRVIVNYSKLTTSPLTGFYLILHRVSTVPISFLLHKRQDKLLHFEISRLRTKMNLLY